MRAHRPSPNIPALTDANWHRGFSRAVFMPALERAITKALATTRR
ncbi:MAG TPA: hypothetical protein VFC38_05695 [Stellaceae bacterium]|nr:hypothetical protein [Stellaceae bacterium]